VQVSLAEVRVGVTYPVAALEAARCELAPAAARRLVLLGETLDASAAVTLGVFDERVPPADLHQRAVAQAACHAALPPNAFATIKRDFAPRSRAHRSRPLRTRRTALVRVAGRGNAAGIGRGAARVSAVPRGTA
jgi:enoyl-CoA hydratase/carnithine racemase